MVLATQTHRNMANQCPLDTFIEMHAQATCIHITRIIYLWTIWGVFITTLFLKFPGLYINRVSAFCWSFFLMLLQQHVIIWFIDWAVLLSLWISFTQRHFCEKKKNAHISNNILTSFKWLSLSDFALEIVVVKNLLNHKCLCNVNANGWISAKLYWMHIKP